MTCFLRMLIAAAFILFAPAVRAAWFMPLPQLLGSTQAGDAFAVSADGSTVVGTGHDGNAFQAVRGTFDRDRTVRFRHLVPGILATRGERLLMEL